MERYATRKVGNAPVPHAKAGNGTQLDSYLYFQVSGMTGTVTSPKVKLHAVASTGTASTICVWPAPRPIGRASSSGSKPRDTPPFECLDRHGRGASPRSRNGWRWRHCSLQRYRHRRHGDRRSCGRSGLRPSRMPMSTRSMTTRIRAATSSSSTVPTIPPGAPLWRIFWADLSRTGQPRILRYEQCG
jgi:hypothetical protein